MYVAMDYVAMENVLVPKFIKHSQEKPMSMYFPFPSNNYTGKCYFIMC